MAAMAREAGRGATGRRMTASLSRLALAMAVAIAAATAQAQSADRRAEGLAAYQRGDYTAAFDALRPLAEAGDPSAAYTVSRLYLLGQGVPRDTGAGLRWERKAAEEGEPHAAYQLGNRYEYGLELEQSYADAARWYRAAAERGLAAAQFRLGLLYASGLGVAADPVAAHMWLNLAAARLPPGEVRNTVAKLRDTVAAKLSAPQIAEAQRRAREWRATGTP